MQNYRYTRLHRSIKLSPRLIRGRQRRFHRLLARASVHAIRRLRGQVLRKRFLNRDESAFPGIWIGRKSPLTRRRHNRINRRRDLPGCVLPILILPVVENVRVKDRTRPAPKPNLRHLQVANLDVLGLQLILLLHQLGGRSVKKSRGLIKVPLRSISPLVDRDDRTTRRLKERLQLRNLKEGLVMV